MSIVIAALAALAFFASSPSSNTTGSAVTAPGQGPVVYDAVLPIGL